MSDIEYKNKYLKYKSKYITLKNKNYNKKALLILFGESFRLGGQNTRNKGSKESYNEQIAAAKTHLKFINLLKEKNINLDVYITSYSTKFDNDIKEIYSPHLINSIFYKDLIIHKNPIYIHLKNSINKISDINSYDFILCMRIDIFLKDKFFEIFNPKWNTIRFPFITWKKDHLVKNKHPRISDFILFIPRKYFSKINHIINFNHNTWYNLVKWRILKYKDLDFMINTYHDSDSAKDFNPLYYIVNREQSKIHHTSSDEIFDKNNFINANH